MIPSGKLTRNAIRLLAKAIGIRLLNFILIATGISLALPCPIPAFGQQSMYGSVEFHTELKSINRQTQPVQQEDFWLTLRILPSVKPETLKLIADITIPETRRVTQGADLRSIIKRKYGSFDEKVYNLFRAFNPQLTSLSVSAEMDVILPAGPRWSLFSVDRMYPVASTYEDIAARETGSSNKTIVKAIKELTSILPKESRQVIEDPRRGKVRKITIPFTTKYVSYRLRPEFAARQDAILNQLGTDLAVAQKEITRASRLSPNPTPLETPTPPSEFPITIKPLEPPSESLSSPGKQKSSDLRIQPELATSTKSEKRVKSVENDDESATISYPAPPPPQGVLSPTISESISSITAPLQRSSSAAIVKPHQGVAGDTSMSAANIEERPPVPKINWSVASTYLDQIPARYLHDMNSGNEVVIAVLDSGIAKDGDEPDKRFFYWHNPEEENHLPEEDDDDNDCKDDIIGCSMLDNGFPLDDLEIPKLLNHGTHVAGLASGRLLPDPVLSVLNSRVRLMILKVTTSQGVIPDGPVANAILYADTKLANVVNMSFEIPLSKSILKHMSDNPRTLYVAAAGNGRDDKGINVDTDSLFLKKLTKSLPNIITVAAHDPEGKLLTSSNFGPNTIDIAAPGQDIESTIAGGQTHIHSGTSQAAPLVSLAAALLIAQGLKSQEVRARLIGSADFVPELQGKIFSEGKLNVAKAVNIREDQVEIREVNQETGVVTRSLLRGKITSPTSLQIPPVAVPLRAVSKIVFDYPTPQGKQQRVLMMIGGKLTPIVLDLGIQTITIKIGEELRDIPASQIIDIIPAVRN
jgi:subtilisin family serine protease